MGVLSGIVTGVILLIIVVVILWLLFYWLYKRATKELAFVRTGFGGQKVVMGGGAFVIPVLHSVTQVNMNTLRLEVRRAESQSLIARDRMRVDVTAEFYIRVAASAEAVAAAAQTLGGRTQRPEQLKELLEGKFVDALRSVAATLTMEELHENRGDYMKKVRAVVAEDLLKNGLELEAASLTALDQTGRDFFQPNNAFDAEGLTKLTNEIEGRRRKRNEIEQDSAIAIQLKNLEAERRRLDITRDEEFARLSQEQEIAFRRSEQQARIAAEEAARRREAEEADITARQQVEIARIVSEQQLEQRRIAKARELEEAEIARTQALDIARVEQARAIEMAEQQREIATAESSQAQSRALAEASSAKAKAVEAEEELFALRDRLRAERAKLVAVIEAREGAEKEAVARIVAAEADRQAAAERVEADKLRTGSETGRIRALAEAEAEAEASRAKARADAEALLAKAAELRHAVENAASKALAEAENTLTSEARDLRYRIALIERLQDIIRESVKPMERIEGIKIVHVDGLTGGFGAAPGGGAGGGEGGPPANLADALVNSALRYRGQAPLVDALLKEIGLSVGDLNGMTQTLVRRADETGE